MACPRLVNPREEEALGKLAFTCEFPGEIGYRLWFVGGKVEGEAGMVWFEGEF